MRVSAASPAAWALVLTLVAVDASATVFHAKDEALALAFPAADRVEDRVVIVTDEQKAAIEKLAHAPLESQLWRIHLGWQGTELLGYAVIDSHVVRTLPETCMIVLARDATVRRVEILAFYEPSEYMPTARWTEQFRDRRLDEDLRLGGAVHGITGATLSATAMTASVRRVVALVKVLVQQGQLPEK